MNASIDLQGGGADDELEDFAHTGRHTLMGRWMRRFWHPIFRSEDLPIKWPKPVRLLNDDYTLFRGESGKVYLTDPRCPHRLTRLHIGWVENETINCRFHGWRFDGATGQCVGQPLEQHPFCEKVNLRTYPVREYLGLIFAYFGDGETPEFPRFPRLELPNVHIEITVNYTDYNYFQNRENDPLHTPFTHRTIDGGAFDLPGVVATIKSRETCWGYSGEVVNRDGMRQTLQFGMPMINNVPGSAAVGADSALGVWTEHFSWKLPVDDEHGVQFLIFAAHVPPSNVEQYLKRRKEKLAEQERRSASKKRPSIKEVAEAVLRGEVLIDDLGPDDVDPPGLGVVMVQDWITQAGQGVVHTNRKKERLASSDATVVMNRKILRRELQALRDGKPLKEWRFDEREVPIYPMGTEAITPELRGTPA